MTVLNDFIILLPPEEAKEKKTESGIVLKQKETYSYTAQGVVTGLGKDAEVFYPDLHIGDTVIYLKGNSTDLTVEGKKYICVKRDALIAVV